MPRITKISTPAKSPRKRSVHLDGRWGFNCLANVVERFGLVVGMELGEAELEKIKGAEVQQKALDQGLAILSRRMHSASEIRGKLVKAKYTSEQVEAAIEHLTKLGYLDDARFAKAKAQSAAEHRKHGRRRAYMELVKSGVEKETARRASEEVFEGHDSLKVARELASKKAPSLLKLDNMTARRRLMGLLLRRGFTFEEIKPVLDETLGTEQVTDAPTPVNRETGEVMDEADQEVGPEAEPGNWRSGLLGHHARGKEKKPSKWRRRR